MTNKEAITYLEWLSNIDFSKKYPTYPMVTNPEQVEALEMAIKALREHGKNLAKLDNSNDEVNNSTNNSTNEIENRVKGMTACRVPEDDYISRQEAIDVCMKYNGQGYVWSCIMGDLRKLPPVQPEIIRCLDCKYGEQDQDGIWVCRGFGVQVGDEDGSGFCANAERRQ